MSNENRYSAKRVYITVICLAFACILSNCASGQKNRFINYNNDNKASLNFDGTIVKDKPFMLEIPEGLKNIHTVVGGSFLHVLTYDNNEKIIILYIPGKATSTRQLINFSYKDFLNFCEKEGILNYLEDMKFKKHKQFGLYKPTADRFYTIYINVKSNQVDVFNYSISSVHY